jgi:hypothetical protein
VDNSGGDRLKIYPFLNWLRRWIAVPLTFSFLIFLIARQGEVQAIDKHNITAGTTIYISIVYNDYWYAGMGFSSDFNGSSRGWVGQNGVWQVDSAYYSSEGVANGSASAAAFQDSEYGNFDYQVMLERLGCKICPTRILVRGVPAPLGANGDWHSGYEFQYTRDGTYSVNKWVDGEKTVLQTWTFSAAILQNDAWNLLRVVADGSSLKFYINGVLVWSGSDASLTSGKVGVGMYRDASTGNMLLVDWATLTVITP